MELKKPIIIAVVLTIIFTLVNYFKHRLLYHPDKIHFAPKPEHIVEIYIPTRNGGKLCAWYYSAGEDREIVLFAHGNAGNITNRIHLMEKLTAHNISFLFFDYRGFGKSKGHSTIESTFHDMEDCYKFITNELKHSKNKIIPAGESIGSYPATKLAVKYNTDKLIILYGIHSLAMTVKGLMPVLYPIVYPFVYNDLRVGDLLKIYNGHVLILHSKTDEIVKYSNATSNNNIANNSTLIEISGGHNTAIIDWEIIDQFIKSS